jgi:hypothetical protein
MFKPGDKVILCHVGTDHPKLNYKYTIRAVSGEYCLFAVPEGDYFDGSYIRNDCFELEEVYNSPLYKALHEN